MNRIELGFVPKVDHVHVGLIGNPNCGKTTLFNLLTGIRQKVGNWPGVTVERKSAILEAAGAKIELVDLPGTYSLVPQSLDERVVKDYLESGEVEVVVNLVDATNLERSLYLTSQILELGLPVVVGLNMMDALEKTGRVIDQDALSARLGCPVVPLIARKKQGAPELLKKIFTAASDKRQPAPISFGEEAEDRLEWVGQVAKEVVKQKRPIQAALSDQVDRLLLNRYLGLPIFLFAMYAVFFISINLSAPFIDLIDQVAGALLVHGLGDWIEASTGQAWVRLLIAEGIGGGVQTVLTFIPPIGFLFLCLSFLEDSGYMARAMVILDSGVRKLGIPGKAVVPMIVGFGCSVPALMATRTLEEERDRRLTLAMVPFMSCGAKLPVYAMFAAAFFPWGGENLVFALYLIGILVGIGTGLMLKRLIFVGKPAPLLVELPGYHLPSPASVLFTTWMRLKRFLLEAGKLIVMVVTLLTLLNSVGTDFSFGNQNSEKSLLAQVGKGITPVFYGMGITDENWPATVGIFSGIFAKEAIIGTLDAMYSSLERANHEPEPHVPVAERLNEAFDHFPSELAKVFGQSPLGLDLSVINNQEQAAKEMNVRVGSFGVMARYFDGQAGAFSYLLWVLLYAPCVAATAALKRESGNRWTWFTLVYMTGLAWSFSTLFYQIARFSVHPLSSIGWIGVVLMLFLGLAYFLNRFGKEVLAANYRASEEHSCSVPGCKGCG